MTAERKYRCQFRWSEQAGCQYAKGDNIPHSECLAPDDYPCKKRNTRLTSALSADSGGWYSRDAS